LFFRVTILFWNIKPVTVVREFWDPYLAFSSSSVWRADENEGRSELEPDNLEKLRDIKEGIPLGRPPYFERV
jgi:hypothetical protein